MLMCADRAEVVSGNLTTAGLGWTWCATPTPALCLVACVLVPAPRLSAGQLEIVVSLEDADGELISQWPATAQLENPNTPGTSYPGAEIPVWVVWNVPSMALEPGSYVFRGNCEGSSTATSIRVIE